MLQKHYAKYAKKLQEFIDDEELASSEIKALAFWANRYSFLNISVSTDNGMFFPQRFEISDKNKNISILENKDVNGNSVFTITDLSAQQRQVDEFENGEQFSITINSDGYYSTESQRFDYELQFSDTKGIVTISGHYNIVVKILAAVFLVILSVAIFCLITFFGMKQKVDYLRLLTKDIRILESGNLSYDVHEQGNDEITELAKNINAMKKSFKSQIKEVEELTETNQKLITGISHDLRTPLTSMLLYAEILQNGHAKNPAQQKEYIDRLIKKIAHIKNLADDLLEYSTNNTVKHKKPKLYLPIKNVLYEEMSGICQYLSEQGFAIQEKLNWTEDTFLSTEENLERIFGNIVSNILKYADKTKPVTIKLFSSANKLFIVFQNEIAKPVSKTDSHEMGISIIKKLMAESEGSCTTRESDSTFEIELSFVVKQ